MITYHGTSLSAAEQLLKGKFVVPGTMKQSLGYSLNTTNNRDEAAVHASIKKYDDINQIGAIVEIETDDMIDTYSSEFVNPSNQYRYDIYQQKKPDMITITLAPGFTIDIIYNMKKIKHCKIVEII